MDRLAQRILLSGKQMVYRPLDVDLFEDGLMVPWLVVLAKIRRGMEEDVTPFQGRSEATDVAHVASHEFDLTVGKDPAGLVQRPNETLDLVAGGQQSGYEITAQ